MQSITILLHFSALRHKPSPPLKTHGRALFSLCLRKAAPDARPGGNGGNYARALAERRTLALELEKAVSEVAQKYRGCLEEYSFPPAYAKIINSLCSA